MNSEREKIFFPVQMTVSAKTSPVTGTNVTPGNGLRWREEK